MTRRKVPVLAPPGTFAHAEATLSGGLLEGDRFVARGYDILLARTGTLVQLIVG